jgi:hypothetical protein
MSFVAEDPYREVVVTDLESKDQAVLLRSHLFLPGRLVLAIVSDDQDGGEYEFEAGALACALDADGIRALRDTMTDWLGDGLGGAA